MAISRLGLGGYGERPLGVFTSRNLVVRSPAPFSRMGLGGYGERLYGPFTERGPSIPVVKECPASLDVATEGLITFASPGLYPLNIATEGFLSCAFVEEEEDRKPSPWWRDRDFGEAYRQYVCDEEHARKALTRTIDRAVDGLDEFRKEHPEEEIEIEFGDDEQQISARSGSESVLPFEIAGNRLIIGESLRTGIAVDGGLSESDMEMILLALAVDEMDD